MLNSQNKKIFLVDCGIIFNEKEPLPPSQTPEYIFKPSWRMIPNPNRIIER